MNTTLPEWLPFRDVKNLSYIPFDDLCSDPGLTKAKDLVDHTELFVLDGSIHDFPKKQCESIAQQFEEQGIYNFVILSGNGYYYFNNINKVLYFPFFWMQTQLYASDLRNQTANSKKYIFSSLNGLPRLHRVLLASYLLKKPYIDKCCLSFNSAHLSCFKYTDQELTNFVKEFFPYKNIDVPEYDPLDHSNLNAAYTDSYVNIISETNTQWTFLTEKTFKALASGQFFISINGPGSIELLRSLGFDVFDDIIDHSYDNITDLYEKIKSISNLLDSLINLDWPMLWESTNDRRRKNVQHFFSNSYKEILSTSEEKAKNL